MIIKNSIILKKAFLILILFSLSQMLQAQAPIYKTWFNIGYEQKIKIKKFKFKVGISQGFRISDIVYNQRYSTFTELGISKKITKHYKLGFSYRANYLGSFRNRIALSNSFKIPIHKKVNLSFRLKYQAEFESNKAFSQDFRLKTNLKWNAHKDYRPYLFGEILYNNTYNYSNFNQYRAGIGLSADYKKKHNFDLMLMFIQEINLEAPRRSLVLGLEYLFIR